MKKNSKIPAKGLRPAIGRDAGWEHVTAAGNVARVRCVLRYQRIQRLVPDVGTPGVLDSAYW